MTTEDDFQRALDAEPDSHITRLAFADWLEERGDPRAAGYRAMGVNRKRARSCSSTVGCYHFWQNGDDRYLGSSIGLDACIAFDWLGTMHNLLSSACHTRREAEDAAARGFWELPANRRAELLTPAALPATPG
jgi:uncharacterized protein (TIGR02996 family)